ncbi:MAG: hypothetical protein R3C01_15615 [Planctomycetaceae bacterium]
MKRKRVDTMVQRPRQSIGSNFRTTGTTSPLRQPDVRLIATVPDRRKQGHLWIKLCDVRFPSNNGSM